MHHKASYKKLWKLLIDKEMSKKKLVEVSGVSPASLAKLGRDGNVTIKVLIRICDALDCDLEDIVELVPDEENDGKQES